jgi:alpha-amylase
VITRPGFCFAADVSSLWTERLIKDPFNSVGNVAALGKWDPRKALALDRTPYRQSNPLWGVTVRLAPGTTVQYKFIKVSSSGKVTWEADPSRTYTVPCKAATVDLEWERR